MSTTSSDSESISDWTLLEHDGDNESTDESSSTGSSVEVLGAPEVSSNSSSSSAGAAVFILRVNSTEPESDESDDPAENSPANEEPEPIAESEEMTKSSSPEQADSNPSEDSGPSTAQVKYGLVHSNPTLTESGSSEVDEHSMKMGDEVSIDDINIVSVKSDSISSDRDSPDSAIDDIEILSLNERPDLGELDKSCVSEFEDKKGNEEDIMEISHHSSIHSTFSFIDSGEQINTSDRLPVMDHKVEDSGNVSEDRPGDVVEVDRSKNIDRGKGFSHWGVITALEVSCIVIFVAVVILNAAMLMGMDVSSTVNYPDERLSSCRLDLKICDQEHDLLDKDFRQMFTKLVEYRGRSKKEYHPEFQDNVAEDFRELLNWVLKDGRRTRNNLEAEVMENIKHRNEINQLRMEVADLRSTVSRHRYAVMPRMAQRELASSQYILELSSECEKKLKKLESNKKLGLPSSNVPQTDKVEIEKAEECDSMLEQIQHLEKELTTETAWSRHIYNLYLSKSDNCSQLLASNNTKSTEESDSLLDGCTNESSKRTSPKPEPTQDTHTEKTWSDSIMDVLNRTQNSVLDVNKQIQDTWKQVKNLSEEMWTKNKPKLDKLQKTFTDKLLKVSERFQNKIERRLKKWYKKAKKHRKSWFSMKPQEEDDHEEPTTRDTVEDHEEPTTRDTVEDHEEPTTRDTVKSFFASSSRRQHTEDQGQENDEHFASHKSWKTECKRYFKQIVKDVTSMDRHAFQQMTDIDVLTLSDKFEEFRTMIWGGTHELLERSKSWFQCQYLWWSTLASGDSPQLGPNCADNLKCWQLKQAVKWRPINCRKWKKSSWNFLRKPCKDPASHKFEELDDPMPTVSVDGDSSNDAVPPNLYESDVEVDNSTEELALNVCDPLIDGDCDETKLSWYINMLEGRKYLRNIEEDASFEGDHKADWIFDRAEDREYERTHPDDWFFRRMKKYEEQIPKHRDD